MTWPELIDRFGVSVAVLIVFSGSVGVALWGISHWMAPRIDKVLNRHIEFVDHVDTNVASQTMAMTRLADLMEKQDERLERLEEISQRQHERLSRVEDKISNIPTRDKP